jgi:peroxiredoxin
VAQVRSHYDQIEALNSEVVVVSFEAGQLVQAWLADTGAPFPLLLDPSRRAYRAFGLERSLLRSWGPKNLWYYTKALLGGRQFYGIGTDTAQLGGDFLIGAGGIVRLAHPSRDPTDRPPVAELLAVLRQLKNNAV